MNWDVLQHVLVALIVAAAMAVALRAAVRAARGQKTTLTACAACKLRDACQRPEKNSAKKCAEKVAQVEKSQ